MHYVYTKYITIETVFMTLCHKATRSGFFESQCSFFCFLANVLRYVRYMLSAVRLSVCLSVCLLSVTLVHPTQAVELFCIFFTIR